MVRDYSKGEIIQIIIDEATAQGVDPNIILAIAEQESGMRNNAISPKNNNGSRDHGVMQLNDKYHKLKNPYDPHENIRYGVKHFKGLLAGAKGDLRKALSDYNAGAGATGKGRRQGDDYARSVLSKYDNLVGKTSPSRGTTTGGASSMRIQKAEEKGGHYQAPQVTRTQPYVTREDLTKAMSAAAQSQDMNNMRNIAVGGNANDQMIRQLLQQYYSTNSISYPNLIKALANLGVSTEELQTIPPKNINADTQSRLEMLNQVGETPEEATARRQDYLNAMQQVQANQNQGVNMYDLLNQAYDQYRQDIQMPTGYSVDPRGLASQALGSTMLANLGADPKNYMGYTDLRNAAYQAQVANQAGVPYDVYMKMREEQLALDKQRIADYLTAQGVIAPTDQAALQQIANLNKEDVDVIKARITAGGQLLTQAEQNQGDIGKQAVSNQGSITTTGMTQAGNMYGKVMDYISNRWNNLSDIEKQRLAGEFGLTTQQMEGEVRAYVADRGYEGTVYSSNQNLAGTQTTAQTQQNIANQKLPVENIKARAQYAEATSPAMGYQTNTPENRYKFDAATLPDEQFEWLYGDVDKNPPQPQVPQTQAVNLFGLFGGNK